MNLRQWLGRTAENEACRYLKKQGLKAIAKNYHCRFGEIDIIMQDNDVLIFVEVRYRKNMAYGRPEETVDRRKQTKIGKTALHFLQTHSEYNDVAVRFDVVALTNNDNNHHFEVEWFKDAFVFN